MNLITCCLVTSIAASVQALPGRYGFKANSLQVFAEAFWGDESCPIPNSISVFAGDGFVRQGIGQTNSIQALEVYGSFFSDCNATYATYLPFYLFQEGADLTFDGLDSASLSFSDTVTLFKGTCTIQTIIEEDFNSTFASCSSGENYTEETLTFDLAIETAGATYLSRSRESQRGPGYVSRRKSRSRCKEQASISWSNVVVGDYSLTVPEDEFYGGDICRVIEGYDERFAFLP